MLSIILALVYILLFPILLALAIFLVHTYLITPLISSKVHKFTPQADWLTTQGILDSDARLEKKRFHFTRSRWFYLEIPYYYADIHVTYLVNGVSYIIRPPLSFNDEVRSLSRHKAAESAAKYESGKRVTVRYDPSNPQYAVLIMETD